MGMNYSITFSAGAQMEMAAGINQTVLPLMAQAVRAIAAQTAQDWKAAVYDAKLWSGEKDAYAESISWTMTGDFTARIEADYKHAYDIENGRPPRDLKKMLDTSTKVRRTLDGRRFLVIPMRQNTSGNGALAKAMPGPIGALAKAMEPSRIVGVGRRQSGEITHLSPKTGMHAAKKQTGYLSSTANKQAATVARNKYAWGGRLSAKDLRDAGASQADVKRYSGMVRMDTSTPGGAKSSAYMTFRIMMEGKAGWVIPAQPGKFIAKAVADAMQPKAEAAFAAAASKIVSG